MAKSYRNQRGALAAAKVAGYEEDQVEVVAVAGGKFMWAPKTDQTEAATPDSESTGQPIEDQTAAEQGEPVSTTASEEPQQAGPNEADVAAYLATTGTVDGDAEADQQDAGDAGEPELVEEDEQGPEAIARRQAERLAAAEAAEQAIADQRAADAEAFDGPEEETGTAPGEPEAETAESGEPTDAAPDPLLEVFEKLDESQRTTLRTGCGSPDGLIRMAVKFTRGPWLRQVEGLIALGLAEEVEGPMLAGAAGDEATKGPNSRFRLTDQGRALCPLAYEEVGFPGQAAARRVLIVVEANTHSNPEAIAHDLAASYGGRYAVTVRDAATYAVLHTGDPGKGTARSAAAGRLPAAPRTPRAPRENQEGTHAAAMITLARRPQGTTRAELASQVTDRKLAWTTMLKNAATANGWVYHSADGADRRTTYWLLDQGAPLPQSASPKSSAAVAELAGSIAGKGE